MKRYIAIANLPSGKKKFVDMSGHGQSWHFAAWMFKSRHEALEATVKHWQMGEDWKNMKKVDPNYTIYEIDFENLTIRKV